MLQAWVHTQRMVICFEEDFFAHACGQMLQKRHGYGFTQIVAETKDLNCLLCQKSPQIADEASRFEVGRSINKVWRWMTWCLLYPPNSP